MPDNTQRNKIHFRFLKGGFGLADRSRLKLFILRIFKREKRLLDTLDFVFCSDRHLRSINKAFLGHDYPTDTISFSYLSSSQPIQGEIYISVDRVRVNAKSYEISFKEELHRVIFHSTLHLCGYQDGSTGQKNKMAQIQEKLLSAYFKAP
jgi:probable rRNA maturation factor